MMDSLEVKFLIQTARTSGDAPYCGVYPLAGHRPYSFQSLVDEAKRAVAEKYSKFAITADDVVIVQITNRSLMADYMEKSKQVFLPGSHHLLDMEITG